MSLLILHLHVPIIFGLALFYVTHC